MDITGV